MLRRLNYKQKTDNREATEVVKGVAKRVIVVKSPDPNVFEEAIFIVREELEAFKNSYNELSNAVNSTLNGGETDEQGRQGTER